MPKNGWVFYFLMLPHFPVLGFTLFHFRMKNHNFHQMLHEPVRLKLATLSWNPENLKKLSLNAYLQIFATKMPYLQIFATKMPYLQVFATKIALLNYMTKTQCLALILSVQDKINQLIANLFY